MSLFLFLLLTQQPSALFAPFEALDPSRFEARPISGVLSPTAVCAVDESLYITADLLDARPGIYRLIDTDNGSAWRAGLAAFLPRQDITGLSYQGGRFCATSARWFDAEPDHWIGHALLVDPTSRRVVDRITTPVLSRCTDESYECGLVGALPLSENRWILVSARNSPEIYLLQKDAKGWQTLARLPLILPGRQAVISEFRLIDETLYFLVRNRWVIAAAPMSELTLEGAWRLQLEPVFDLKKLRDRFVPSHPTASFEGFAEGFELDTNGKLHVVLNNRGYAFDSIPGGKAEKRSVLVSFTPEPKEKEPEPQ